MLHGKSSLAATVAAVLIVSLAACGGSKKADAPAAPEKPPVVVPPSDNGSPTPPAQPADASKTAIEGTWETACQQSATGFARKVIKVDRNVLAYTRYEFAADDVDCEGDGVPARDQYYVFKITALNDAVMTHQVDYVTPTGSIEYSWVLRLSGTEFLSSEIAFLKDRSTTHYNDTYYKQ